MSSDHDPAATAPSTAAAALKVGKTAKAKQQGSKKQSPQQQQLPSPNMQFVPYLGPAPSAAAASDAIAAAASALANGSSAQLMSAMQHFLANTPNAPAGNPMSEFMFQPQLNQLHTVADHVRAIHALADLIERFSTLPPPSPTTDPLRTAIPGLFVKGTLAFIPLSLVPVTEDGVSMTQSVIISDATKLRMDTDDLVVNRYMIQRSAIIMQLPPILVARALSRASLQRENIAIEPVVKDVCTLLQFMLRPLSYNRRMAPLVSRLEMSHAKLLVTILLDFIHDMFTNTAAPPCTSSTSSHPASTSSPSPTPQSHVHSPNSRKKAGSSSRTNSSRKSPCLIPRPLLQSLLDYLAYCADPATLASNGDQAIQILALCDMYAWLHDDSLHICSTLDDLPAAVVERLVKAIAQCHEYPTAPMRATAGAAAAAPEVGGKSKTRDKDSGSKPPTTATKAASSKDKAKASSAAADAWLIHVPEPWQLTTVINARRAHTVQNMFASANSILDPDSAAATCRSGIRELHFSSGPRLDITVEEDEHDDDEEDDEEGDAYGARERVNPLLLRDAARYLVRAVLKHPTAQQFAMALVKHVVNATEAPLTVENAPQAEVGLSLVWAAVSVLSRPERIPSDPTPGTKGAAAERDESVLKFVQAATLACQSAVASKDPLLCASAIRAAWTLIHSPTFSQLPPSLTVPLHSKCTNAITDGLAVIFSPARKSRAHALRLQSDLLARSEALDVLALVYRSTLTSRPSAPLATWIVDSFRVFGSQVHASLSDEVGQGARHLLGKVIQVLEAIPLEPFTAEDGSYGGAGIADRTALAAFNAHVSKHVYREWESLVAEQSSARWAQVMWMAVLTMRLTWSKDGGDRNPFYGQAAIHQYLNQAWRAIEEPTKLCPADCDDPVDDDDDWEDIDLTEYEAIVADERHVEFESVGRGNKHPPAAGGAPPSPRPPSAAADGPSDVAVAATPEFTHSDGDGLEAASAEQDGGAPPALASIRQAGSSLMHDLYAAMVTADDGQDAHGHLHGLRDYGDSDHDGDGDKRAAPGGVACPSDDGDVDDGEEDQQDQDRYDDDLHEDAGRPEFNIRYLLSVDCALLWVSYHHNFKAVDEEWAQLKSLLDVGATDPHLLHTQATGKLLGFAFNLPCLHMGNRSHHPEARHGRCHGPKLLDMLLHTYFDEAWADAKTVLVTHSVPASKYPIMHTTLMAAIRHTVPLLRGFRSNVAYLGPAHWIKDEQEKRIAAIIKELIDVSADLSANATGPLPWATATPAPTDCSTPAHVQRDALLAQFEAMLLLSPDWKWLSVMFRYALRQVPTAQNARANFISQVLLGPTLLSPWVRGAPAQHVLLLAIVRSLIFHFQSPAPPSLAATDVQAIVSLIADVIPDPVPMMVKQGGFAPRGDPMSDISRGRSFSPYDYRPAAPADRVLSPATVWVLRSLERLMMAYRSRVLEGEFDALLDGIGGERIERLLDMGVDADVFELNGACGQ